MPGYLHFGVLPEVSGVSAPCIEPGRNPPRDSQRRPWTHPDFPDAGSKPILMAHFGNAHHITWMANLTMPLRIFIADDSPLIRERVASMLCASAMTIVGQAETPQDSIKGILAMYPDVVVLDVQLDGGSGLQVLRAIRHAAPHIAFVVFSNTSEPGYRKCYLEAGAENFIDKTYQFDQLVQAVSNASQHLRTDTQRL